MTTTSDAHNVFTYEVFKNGFFSLDSSEVRLSFLIKMGTFKAGQI